MSHLYYDLLKQHLPKFFSQCVQDGLSYDSMLQTRLQKCHLGLLSFILGRLIRFSCSDNRLDL